MKQWYALYVSLYSSQAVLAIGIVLNEHGQPQQRSDIIKENLLRSHHEGNC